MDEFRKIARERLAAEKKARKEKKMIPGRRIEHDVLCGRGHSVHKFPGNVYFRVLVGSFIEDFVTSTTTADKSSIAKDILSQIKGRDPPGRFLQKRKNIARSGMRS